MSGCVAFIPREGSVGRERNVGRICGEPVKAFVAPGVGHCGDHVSLGARRGARAVRDAIADIRALRDVPQDDEHGGYEKQPRGDEQPDGPAHFEWPEGWTELSADKHVA